MLSVLIADDESIVCNGLRQLIPWEHLNAEIIGEARDGSQAWELAIFKRPDVVITDVRMPIMDGLELCRRVHKMMPETISIILSAYDDFSYAQTAIQYGVSDYIVKPIDKQKINKLIDKIKNITLLTEKKQNLYQDLCNTLLEDELIMRLKNGDREFFNNFFTNRSNDLSICSIDLVRQWCLKLFNIFFETVDSLGLNVKVLDINKQESWQRFLNLKSQNEMRNYIEKLYLTLSQFISDKKNSRNSAIVDYVKKYINLKYTDPNITVYSIADELKLSPNYLSIVFRQNTGENISRYITRLRINKAKILLKNPLSTINDVAQMVGYNDPHYFTKVFKKMESITPSKYKNLVLYNSNWQRGNHV